MADEIARSAVFFRTSSNTGKPDATTASASAVPTANAAAGLFNPVGAEPASTAAQPNNPTAIQNRQNQKKAFMGERRRPTTSPACRLRRHRTQ